MMQPEDKIQEIAERAERLQEIGSSILRAMSYNNDRLKKSLIIQRFSPI